MKAEDYLQLPEVTYHEIPVMLDDKSRKAYATWNGRWYWSFRKMRRRLA